MNYTKGPWKAGQWSNGRQWVYQGAGPGPDQGKPICEVRGDTDAHLIAAAPDMLDLLYRWLVRDPTDHESNKDIAAETQALLSALEHNE